MYSQTPIAIGTFPMQTSAPPPSLLRAHSRGLFVGTNNARLIGCLYKWEDFTSPNCKVFHANLEAKTDLFIPQSVDHKWKENAQEIN